MRSTHPLAIALVLIIASSTAHQAGAGVHPLWDKYLTIYEDRADLPDISYHGRIHGDWSERPEKQFMEAWPYRGVSWEVLCATGKDLARLVYGLALFTHDLDPSVDLERFEHGAQGFHYSLDQVVDWANALLSGQIPPRTTEELMLLGWLAEDGIITIENGAVRAGTVSTHVMGAAPGKRRSLDFNLRHERLHVNWDEDTVFREEFTAAWENLSQDEKEQVFQELSGYDRENLPSIIEEWAVRTREKNGVW